MIYLILIHQYVLEISAFRKVGDILFFLSIFINFICVIKYNLING